LGIRHPRATAGSDSIRRLRHDHDDYVRRIETPLDPVLCVAAYACMRRCERMLDCGNSAVCNITEVKRLLADGIFFRLNKYKPAREWSGYFASDGMAQLPILMSANVRYPPTAQWLARNDEGRNPSAGGFPAIRSRHRPTTWFSAALCAAGAWYEGAKCYRACEP